MYDSAGWHRSASAPHLGPRDRLLWDRRQWGLITLVAPGNWNLDVSRIYLNSVTLADIPSVKAELTRPHGGPAPELLLRFDSEALRQRLPTNRKPAVTTLRLRGKLRNSTLNLGEIRICHSGR